MSKTDAKYLRGKVKWAQVNKPDSWGNWKVNLYLDQSGVAEFQNLKVKNTIKTDEDGSYVVLRRPTQKMIKGKVVGFTAPTVVDPDGLPFHGLIGNGSDVTVKVDYYSYKSPLGESGNAVRLAGLRVDNLVPFKPADMIPEDAETIGGMSEQPAPNF